MMFKRQAHAVPSMKLSTEALLANASARLRENKLGLAHERGTVNLFLFARC